MVGTYVWHAPGVLTHTSYTIEPIFLHVYTLLYHATTYNPMHETISKHLSCRACVTRRGAITAVCRARRSKTNAPVYLSWTTFQRQRCIRFVSCFPNTNANCACRRAVSTSRLCPCSNLQPRLGYGRDNLPTAAVGGVGEQLDKHRVCHHRHNHQDQLQHDSSVNNSCQGPSLPRHGNVMLA